MLFATHTIPSTYRPLLTAPAWQEVLAWIDQRDPELPDGIYPIRGEEIFVNQHRYETLPREECRWESHRRYLDLQFCLEGTEIIDVTDRDRLTDDGAYDEEKDLLFHHAPASLALPTTPLVMTPGSMAIFTPTDAHRPKVAVDTPAPVRKFVVKISLASIEG